MEVPANPNRLPTAKLTAIARFKSYTGSILSIRDKRPTILFPPPSWDIKDFGSNLTAQPTTSSSDVKTAQDSNIGSRSSDGSPPEEAVEPVTFAQKLRVMIELLPLPGGMVSKAHEGEDTPESSSQSPVPTDIDPGLVKMLSSEDVMNGDTGEDGKDKTRPSIWNILAGLRRSENDGGDGSGKSVAVEAEQDGLMMYAPLEPKADSQVCLAESENITHNTPSAFPNTAHDSTQDDSIPKPSPIETRVWVPSTTEISVLTAWWGYRLYLPPPVMAKLGASSVKAAARAAMITSALKWMLDKIPLAVIPIQFRPAVKMLKSLAPMAGYVGVFLAWSWDRIRALDEGNGVVLTATWLLPVALLPLSWDAGTIYRPILLPNPEELRQGEASLKAQENKNDGDGNDKGDKKQKSSKFRIW